MAFFWNAPFHILFLYFKSKVDAANSIFCALAKYQNEFSRHGGFKAISKPQSIISTLYLWKTHMNWGGYWSWWKHTRKICVRSRKKMPPRDLQFPQSPVNLNISTKWRDSQGQRRRLYLHKSWEESSQEKKKKKTNSSAHKHHSVLCKHFFLCIRHIFPLGYFPASLISWFICFARMFCCLLRFRLGWICQPLCTTISICFGGFFSSSLCVCSTLTLLRVNFHLARRGRGFAFKARTAHKKCLKNWLYRTASDLKCQFCNINFTLRNGTS